MRCTARSPPERMPSTSSTDRCSATAARSSSPATRAATARRSKCDCRSGNSVSVVYADRAAAECDQDSPFGRRGRRLHLDVPNRAVLLRVAQRKVVQHGSVRLDARDAETRIAVADPDAVIGGILRQSADRLPGQHRSEEHTSELQSRFDLVCRLLLEKKNLT